MKEEAIVSTRLSKVQQQTKAAWHAEDHWT